MAYNPNIHNRQSIRMKGYDYAQEGLYFITLCTQNREHIFGEIIDGIMQHTQGGEMAYKCWFEIPQHFPNVKLHEFIVMPNHIHGIIEIGANKHSPNMEKNHDTNNHSPETGARNYSPENIGAKNHSPHPSPHPSHPYKAEFKSPSKTVGSIVRGYKIGVTKWFRQNTDIYEVWQRNYHDIIIRDEKAYDNISNYIVNNPSNWKEDKFR